MFALCDITERQTSCDFLCHHQDSPPSFRLMSLNLGAPLIYWLLKSSKHPSFHLHCLLCLHWYPRAVEELTGRLFHSLDGRPCRLGYINRLTSQPQGTPSLSPPTQPCGYEQVQPHQLSFILNMHSLDWTEVFNTCRTSLLNTWAISLNLICMSLMTQGYHCPKNVETGAQAEGINMLKRVRWT